MPGEIDLPFPDAASLERGRFTYFPVVPGKLEFAPEAITPRPEVSIFDLVNAVNSVLKRFNRREDLRDIFEDKWTVSEKIEQLLRLLAERQSLRFSELFEGVTSRSEVVVTFLALLELYRARAVAFDQSEPLGVLQISWTGERPTNDHLAPSDAVEVEDNDD